MQFTLKSLRGFELKMKKILNIVTSEILASYRGIRGMMTHWDDF
jgi:hypothetical protein